MATTGTSAAVDSNDALIGYIAETAWGVTPAGALQLIRLDGEGFTGSVTSTRPNEIDANGQASAEVDTKEESVGSLNVSISAGLAYNTLLAASMKGVWTTPVSYSGTDVAITVADASARTCTLTATAGAFTTTNALVIGQFIKVYAAGTFGADCSFTARILTVAAASLTLDCVSSATIKVAAATTEMAACTIKGSMLRNGTTINTFSFEKKLAAALFLRYTGCLPTGSSLDVGEGDYLKSAMPFINKAEYSSSDTSAEAVAANALFTALTTPQAAPTASVIDSVNGIGTVWRGVNTGTAPGVPAVIAGTTKKMGVKWDQEGAASQHGIGSASAVGVRSGKILGSGSLSTYFKTFALYLQYKNKQRGMVSFSALDGAATASGTKGYVITICNARLKNPKIVCGGPGQDVMADFEIAAEPDITSTQIFGGKTIQIDYFG